MLRLALYVPISAFPIDSDGVLAGLCAFALRAGRHTAFFPGGYRLGSASCYVTAAFFALGGRSRAALAATGLTWGALYLAASVALARAALGARAACIALIFVALPAAAFLTVTYVPWGYGEIAASCAATLLLAIVWRRGFSPWIAVAFGLSAGLGAWMSLQTAMVTVPAIVWTIAYRRPNVARELIPALLAACVGASPWLIANLGGGFPTFAHNWVAVPVTGGAALWSNATWFAGSTLAQLFVYGGAPSTWIPLCGGVALALGAFVLSLRRNEAPSAGALHPRELAWLFGGMIAMAFLLDVPSTAGSVRGWTVRYAAPLYAGVPLAFGLGIDWLWRGGRRVLAALAVALLVLPNLTLYALPGTAAREVLRAQLRDDSALRAFLAAHHIDLAYGDYFDVYHLNFDAHGVTVAVPTNAALDYLDYGPALQRRPVSWAAIVPRGTAPPPWLVRSGVSVTAYDVGGMRAFVASRRAGDAAALLASLRQAAQNTP
ncbi:MAG TPA: hypothetical protein VGF18_07355 [Candidatus Tumulicola sp.]